MSEEYKSEEHKNCFLCNHPLFKAFLTGLMVFLGAFAAFYVVADWHFKRMLDPVYQMRKMDRAIMKQEHMMNRQMMKEQNRIDKMARKNIHQGMKADRELRSFIHMEKTDDEYKIIIDLEPFDNNEKNVEVAVNGKTLTINAAGEKNIRNREEVVRYSQNLTFGDDVDLNKISKIREGNKYIIIIPEK